MELRIDVPCAASPSWRRAIRMDAEVNWSIGDVKARLCEERGINLPFFLKLTDLHIIGAAILEQDDEDVDDIVGNVLWLQVIPEDCAGPDCEVEVIELLRLFTAEHAALVESSEESEEEEEEEEAEEDAVYEGDEEEVLTPRLECGS